MIMDKHIHLSRRERQIMDILYQRGYTSVKEISRRLPKPPSHTAVRTLLRILDERGHVKREKRGLEFFYTHKHDRDNAGQTALNRVIQTFYDGSFEKAVAAHLAQKSSLSSEELKRIASLINKARKQGQ